MTSVFSDKLIDGVNKAKGEVQEHSGETKERLKDRT